MKYKNVMHFYNFLRYQEAVTLNHFPEVLDLIILMILSENWKTMILNVIVVTALLPSKMSGNVFETITFMCKYFIIEFWWFIFSWMLPFIGSEVMRFLDILCDSHVAKPHSGVEEIVFISKSFIVIKKDDYQFIIREVLLYNKA